VIQIENYLFLFLIIVVAIVLSFSYYRRQVNSKSWILGVLRFCSIFTILLLLLSPILKCNKTKSIKPKVIFLVDNSKSISNFKVNSLKSEITQLKNELSSQNYEIDIRIFDRNVNVLDSLNQKGVRTDIYSALNTIITNHSEENLNRIVLFTDGNFNEGNNPVFIQNKKLLPIDVVLIGDTTILSDLRIENIEFNKIMNQEEVNTVNVIISAISSEGTNAIVSIEEVSAAGIKQIAQTSLNVSSKYYSHTVQFKLTNPSKGKHFYRATIKNGRKEVNVRNNIKEFTVEVIDGNKQVEIVSNYPHPDISAFKSWIQGNKNFKVKLNVSEISQPISDQSDLIIFYQIPNQLSNAKALFEKAKLSGKSVLFILGTKTDYSIFNQLQQVYRVNVKGNIIQDYGAFLNPNFGKFYLNEPNVNAFQNYPPLSNYLMTIESKPDAHHLLMSRIGRINSEQPLVSFAVQDNIQIGIIAAENIWKWRMNNYQSKKNFNESQDLMDKIINYLTIQKDKKQLVSFLSNDYISEGDMLTISANTYNALYQPKKASNVKCFINGVGTKNVVFDMLPMDNSYSLTPKNLKAGRYTYKITADLDGKSLTDEGSFVIYEDDIEATYMPSNFEDMHVLTEKTGGNLILWKDRFNIEKKLDSIIFKEKLLEETMKLRANDVIYLLLFILGFLSIEWLTRKYYGLN